MKRTKAAFKATRERVGMSVSALAKRLGVNERSVRYWEREDNLRMPPEDAWRMLDKALAQQRRVVAFTLDKAAAIEDGTIRLPYWTCEADYVQWSTDTTSGIDADWQMANASQRAAATLLEQQGVTVKWVTGNPVLR